MDPNNDPARVLVHRAIPTDPGVRSSPSLFLAESQSQPGRPERRLLFSGPAPAPAPVARRMAVGEGDELWCRRRLMLVDGIPLRLAVSWFPAGAPETKELSGDGFLEGGLQELFSRHGRRFGRAEETLAARPADPGEPELLAIAPGAPVVEIVRTSYDDGGRPVHTLQTICAAERHLFDVRQMPGDAVF